MVLPPEADYSGIARNNEVRSNPGPVSTEPAGPVRSGVDPAVVLLPQSLSQLTCSYNTENQTRYLSCDLGNPMKAGTSVSMWHQSRVCGGGGRGLLERLAEAAVFLQVWAGLRFTVPWLKDTQKTIQFELQIRR